MSADQNHATPPQTERPVNQAPILKLAPVTHGLRTGRGRRHVEFQAAMILEQQAVQLDLALSHLDKVLNGCRSAHDQQAADTAAREFLLECGR